MLWIGLTFLAALLWMGVDLSSKFVVEKELEDPVVAAGTCGLTLFLAIGIVSLFLGELILSLDVLIPSTAVGVFYSLALLTYYSGIEKEEVSRFIPTLSITTIFTVVLAFLFIGESFTYPVYGGIGAVVAGAILISLKDSHHFQSLKGFLLGVLAGFLFASRNIFLKFATSQASLWSILLWVGFGGFVTSTLFLIIHYSRMKRSLKAEKHLLLIGSLSSLGYFAYAGAISLGPVSLASAVLKVKILLVFSGSLLLSRAHPEILKEKMDRLTVLQKLIAAFLIIGGVALIHIFS